MKKFIREHLAPTLHNSVGGLITAASLVLLTFFASLFAPMRSHFAAILSAPMPLWLGALVIIGVSLTLWFVSVSRRTSIIQVDPHSSAKQAGDSDHLYRDEVSRLQKLAADHTQTSKEDQSYITILESRLKERGLDLPRRPPKPPVAVMPNYLR